MTDKSASGVLTLRNGRHYIVCDCVQLFCADMPILRTRNCYFCGKKPFKAGFLRQKRDDLLKRYTITI